MNKTYYVAGIPFDDESALKHYRTPGSKNGVRKYQNPDGSLTPLGRIHYGVGQAVRKVGNTVTNAYNSGREYITGEEAKRRLARAQGATGYHFRLGSKQYNDYANQHQLMANLYRSRIKEVDPDKFNRINNEVSQYASKSQKYASAAARNANQAKMNSKETKDMSGKTYGPNKGKADNASRQRERNELMAEKMRGKSETAKIQRNKMSETMRSNVSNNRQAYKHESEATTARRTANRLAAEAAGRERTLYEAQKAYDRTLPGQMDRLRDSFNTTYDKVVEYAKDAAEELYGTTSKYYKQTVKAITTGGKQAIDKAKKFLASIFG